jgi:hypothetical protein
MYKNTTYHLFTCPYVNYELENFLLWMKFTLQSLMKTYYSKFNPLLPTDFGGEMCGRTDRHTSVRSLHVFHVSFYYIEKALI